MKNEVDLFKHRFNVLNAEERKKFYEVNLVVQMNLFIRKSWKFLVKNFFKMLPSLGFYCWSLWSRWWSRLGCNTRKIEGYWVWKCKRVPKFTLSIRKFCFLLRFTYPIVFSNSIIFRFWGFSAKPRAPVWSQRPALKF